MTKILKNFFCAPRGSPNFRSKSRKSAATAKMRQQFTYERHKVREIKKLMRAM